MKCELSSEEAQHIERYRDLLPEFQKALDKQLNALFELQRQILKETLVKPRKNDTDYAK